MLTDEQISAEELGLPFSTATEGRMRAFGLKGTLTGPNDFYVGTTMLPEEGPYGDNHYRRSEVGIEGCDTMRGRYPFIATAREYMDKRKNALKQSTLVEMERKFRYLGRVLSQLRDIGKVTTTDPGKLTREDVGSFIFWMRDKNIDQSTQVRYLGFIEALTSFRGNPVIDELRSEKALPRPVNRDIRTLDAYELLCIRDAASQLVGWRRAVALFLVSIYPNTGLRASELRLANIEDLDLRRWTMVVRHPKGEGKYGRERTITVPPPARAQVLEYLGSRRIQLTGHGLDSSTGPLVPCVRGGKANHYSSNAFRVIKAQVERKAGVEFKLKDFRSTFAQVLIDHNPEMVQCVSRQLGHATTTTTEKYYGRIRPEKAFQGINDAFAEINAMGGLDQAPQEPTFLIDQEDEWPGLKGSGSARIHNGNLAR